MTKVIVLALFVLFAAPFVLAPLALWFWLENRSAKRGESDEWRP